MSKNFVKALHLEVQERITKIQEVDAEQYALLSAEHNDLVSVNKTLEDQLETTQGKLSKKTEEATQQRSLAVQLQKDLNITKGSHESEITKLNENHETATKVLTDSATADQLKWDTERSELKEEHKEEVRKLSEKKDELHEELQVKTAKLAEATVKTENYGQLTTELEQVKSQISELTSDNLKNKAELDSKTQALEAASQTIADNIQQRNKAQADAASAKQDLKTLNDNYNNLLALALESGVKMQEIKEQN